MALQRQSSISYLIMAVLGLTGTVLVLVATSVHGPGLTPDSVAYVSTARNLAQGHGATLYSGEPMLAWPPFYPAVLAAIKVVVGIDPLQAGGWVNALAFGCIIFVSGVLCLQYASSVSGVAICGAAIALIAGPGLRCAAWALSGTLFVLLTLSFLLLLGRYLQRPRGGLLALVSGTVAASCLTRYVGVTLVATGVLSIILLQRDKFLRRLVHAGIFAVVSVAPLFAWVVRNWFQAGTLFGARGNARFTFVENIVFVFDTVMQWFLPARVVASRPLLLLLGLVAGGLLGLLYARNGERVRNTCVRCAPVAFFVLVYTAFLILSASTKGFDRIDDRLMLPAYVPLLVLLLAALDIFLPAVSKLIGPTFTRIGTVAVMGAVLAFPVRALASDVAHMRWDGVGGYSSSRWRGSSLVRYFRERNYDEQRPVLSNRPDVLYIAADMDARMAPRRKHLPEILLAPDPQQALNRLYPELDGAYFAWFHDHPRRALCSSKDLQDMADFRTVVNLADGDVYIVSLRAGKTVE